MMPRHRGYSDDELALFARYQNERAFAQPELCTLGERCWVKCGPPGITSDGICRECQMGPVMLALDGRVRRRRYKTRKSVRL